MLHYLINLLFPETCVCCEDALDEQEEYICAICLKELPVLEIDNEAAYSKLAGRVKLHKAYAYLKFNKSGKAQKILHELKYKNNQELGIFIGRHFANYLAEQNATLEIDLLMPVPLHPKRLQSRGYNQAEAIAKGLAESTRSVLDTHSLVKSKEALSQTRKGRTARLENMEDCFSLVSNSNLAGKHVGIVDDVMTTGATLEACCVCLEKAGVEKITVLSLAVA